MASAILGFLIITFKIVITEIVRPFVEQCHIHLTSGNDSIRKEQNIAGRNRCIDRLIHTAFPSIRQSNIFIAIYF